MENKMKNKNIALILTAPEKKLKKPEPPKKPEKQYGLPKGFKLIGFDIEV